MRKCKLSECVKEINDRTIKNNQYEVLTSSKNGIFSQEEYFDKQVASKDTTGYKIIKNGQFTYRSMSDSGTFTINRLEDKEIGIVSPAYPVFEATNIDAEFLKYYFKSELFNKAIINLSQGSTRTALKFKDLIDIEIYLPEIEEQKRIVKILKNNDKVMEKYDELIKEKEQFIKSQFVEMFGSIKERVKISDCCKKITDYVASGSFASLHENVKTYDTENYAIMVKTADFANGFKKGLTYTDEQGYNFLNNSNLYGGELLLSNIGASIGKVHRVPKLDKKMTLAPNSIMLITNEFYIEDYLQYYFLSDEGQKVLKSMETATAMPKFNKTQLKDIKIPKVELNEQIKFSKVVQLIDKQKFNYINKIKELKEIINIFLGGKKNMNEEIPIANELTTSQKPALEVLKKLGYKKIPSEEENGEYNNLTIRQGDLNQVLLKDILEKKLNEINSYEYQGKEYKFTPDTIGQAIKDLNASLLTGLINTNETIYDLLTIGKSYTQRLVDGSTRSFDIKFIDFENPEKNDFYVTEEYSVMRSNGKNTARPDIVMFINGIPLAIIECKDVGGVSITQGISQNIRNQKPEYIPELMKFIQILVSANKNAVKYATVGTPEKFWMVWNEKDTEWQKNILSKVVVGREITKQDRDIVSLFEPTRFLEIIKDFVIFDAGIKKVPRYQQYFATKSIVKRLTVDKEGGVVWHTQGSGKSITMVYVTKKIMEDKYIRNPQVLIVTDRLDLDKQIMKTFNRIGIQAKRASTGDNLVKLIQDDNIRVITSIVNKFETVVNKGVVVDAPNTFILVDEGHRTEYGEMNRRMREVFKNALYVSFTGTPIMKKDRDIFKKFGGLIDKYSLDDALQDKAIVPLIYEGKMVDQDVSKVSIDRQLDLITRDLNEMQKQEVIQKWSRFEKVASTEKRLGLVAMDVAENYTKYWQGTGFNAMLATNKKVDAVRYYNFFEENYPEIKTAVVISAPDMREGEDDIQEETSDVVKKFYLKAISNYKNEEEYEETIKSKFVNGDIDILIVVDKLLTGFDAPKASVLYLDKQIKEHNLLQAIARVNRLYDGKDYGYIVDYRGLLGELDKALTMYKDAGLEEFELKDIDKSVYYIDSEVDKLHNSYDELVKIFNPIKNKNDMEEYEVYLENEDIRKDFYDKLCNFGSLLGLILQSDSGYYKVGKERIIEYRKALAFYQKLRATVKLRYTETIDHKEYESKMQKLLDDYVIATEVMKITEPVDITNTTEFNKELSRIESKAGKADAIRTRLVRTISQKIKTDPAFYKKFSERIEETIRAYRERRIDDSKYLEDMQNITEDFRSGNAGIVYPSNITNEKSRAYYGIIRDKFEKVFGDKIGIEELGELTLKIQEKVENKIKVDWKQSEDVINSMKQDIDDILFFYLNEKNLNIDFNEIDSLIETIIEITISNY